MDEETKRTLITCGTTIFVAIFTNILVYAMSKLDNKKQNDKSILDNQYKQIFAPINKILFYDISDGKSIQYSEIDKILSENYYLIPKSILNSFSNIDDIENDMESFKNDISTCFQYLSSILGYSKENLSGHDRRAAKKILSSNSFDYAYSKMVTYFIIGSVVISSIINIIYGDYTDIIRFISSIVGYTFVIFMSLMALYLLIMLIPIIYSYLCESIKKHISKKKEKKKLKCNKELSNQDT